MKPAALLLALVFTGCTMGADGSLSPPDLPDAPQGVDPGPDAPGGCQVSLEYAPAFPVAGPSTMITVVSTVLNAPGTLTYNWHVRFKNVAITFSRENDHKQIVFNAAEPGIYSVDLEVTGSSTFCSPITVMINVGASGARNRLVRLHVVAPPGRDAVPVDEPVMIPGGADLELQDATVVAAGMRMNPIVSGPNGPLPAYLRFIPNGEPDAIIEAFSDSNGATSVVLDTAMYTVLIVPSRPDAPARRIVNWTAANPFLVADAGVAVNGELRDPANAAIAGAKVQLSIDGVPSTLATTAADGRFHLLAPSATGPVTVEVVPPEATGLPRLSATSSMFDLAAVMEIRYAASLARRDLAGTRMLRDGAPVGARVSVVGSLEEAGTVTAGTGAPVAAAGEVRVTASTDGSGALPTMRVPAATLSAVIEVAPGDLAVVALDTTGDVPASLDAPALAPLAITVMNEDTTALPGAMLDLVPVGALAMAAVPVLHVTADADSAIHAAIAAGGRYDLRFRDPAGRGASLVVTDRTATTIEPSYQLPPKLQLSGRVTYKGQPLANASLQILCMDCTGIERARPIAETVSNATGRFTLAVPDPGTM
jgi:hypothetical protein